MSIQQREVQIYRDNNEKIIKSQENILQILNMLQKQDNKDSSTKQEASSRHVTACKSHSIRDEHGNDKNSRRRRKFHHSPNQSTRKSHAILGLGSIPSVSLVRR